MQVKSFERFMKTRGVNESSMYGANAGAKAGGVAVVSLEFEWTWADQKDEQETQEIVRSLLMDLPKSIKVEDVELIGWDRDEDDEPDYSMPYLLDLTLAFRGDTNSFTSGLLIWIESSQLLELAGIDFN